MYTKYTYREIKPIMAKYENDVLDVLKILKTEKKVPKDWKTVGCSISKEDYIAFKKVADEYNVSINTMLRLWIKSVIERTKEDNKKEAKSK